MEKEKLESLLIDYLDGQLSPSDRQRVEEELKKPEVKVLHDQLKEVINAMDKSADVQPARGMKQRFQSMLQEEMLQQQKESKGREVFFSPVFLRAAAGVALVMVGVSIGYWINKNQQRDEELAEIKREMQATKNVMMAMLDNQQSASQRLAGVTVAFKMEKADDEIVSALVKTMNEDANTNVRLAALEALGKFHQLPHVRQALINSLATQNNPVVQIELIRLMVQMKEKDAVKELERITTDDKALPVVKDEAHAGLLRLS
ncbi:MAG: HEAT repeat domain-containing protein [Bacteroidota bacterium]